MRVRFIVGLLLASSIFIQVEASHKKQYQTPIQQVLTRLIGIRANEFITESIRPDNGKDVFEIESIDSKIVLRGSSPAAIGFAFNWYLKYYCHNQISKVGSNVDLPNVLPKVPKKVHQISNFEFRYYLNYCTFNYTMSFWDWNKWEKEIDWMIINGINMPLAMIGNEAVWQRTLRKFNFTEKEIIDFIPGPSYTAWWLMGNLEGWGGPVSQQWIDSRVELQQKIVRRMRQLKMKPVFQGFYGIVPDLMRQKYPQSNIYFGGIWAGKNGFQRPAFLDPNDTLFPKIAKVYYEEQAKLYGDAEYYGGDPFHEGGEMKNIDVTKSASVIQKEMTKAHPNSTWVLQGWWENPSDELLAGIDKDKVVILDLFGESRPQWENRKGFDGRKWMWCTLLNFGGKNGLYGKLDTFAIEPIRALKSPFGNKLCGIGTMMEGSETNPVNFELIYEMAWRTEVPSVKDWIVDFANSRYGTRLPNVGKAWEILYKTAYSCPTKQEGPSESVFCARGSINVTGAFNWGTVNVYYDAKKLLEAFDLLASAKNELHHKETYQYDMVDLARQILANRGQEVYKEMIKAFKDKNKQQFEQNANLFLSLIRLQDNMLASRKEFLLGRWLEMAKNYSTSIVDRQMLEQNARMLITVWGNKGVAEELHDYSNREWSGLLKDFYLPRWEMFIDQLRSELSGNQSRSIDYYTFENDWTKQRKTYQSIPKGDPVKLAIETVLMSKSAISQP